MCDLGDMEPFRVLMAMGARVREVPDLAERCLWLPKAAMLVIDRGLSSSERASVADQVLIEAAATQPSSLR